MEDKERFLCLCMAPALDVTIELDRVPEDGAVVKDVRETVVPGGKGLNVARYLAARGAKTACGGVLGRDDALRFERELARCGIEDVFTRVDGEVRRNEMLVMPGRSCKLNRSAYPGLAEFDIALPPPGSAHDTAVVSGSLPKAFGNDYYARLIARLRDAGYARIVLDASGAALKHGLEAKPDLIKPNAEECAELVGFALRGDADFLRATEILRSRIPHVIISDGANGAWFDGVRVPAPRVEARDTTAAGDTLLAEYCFSADPALAVAAGAMATTVLGSEPPFEWLRKLA